MAIKHTIMYIILIFWKGGGVAWADFRLSTFEICITPHSYKSVRQNSYRFLKESARGGGALSPWERVSLQCTSVREL